MIKFLKPLSFLPAIFMMYIIFSFSAQEGVTSSQLSYKVSYEIVEIGGKVIGADLDSWEIDSLATRFHGVIRKIAHMAEYFALAVAVAFPLYVYGLRGILLMIVAGLFCVAFACGDEYHQSYVAGRSPSKRDVLIDSFGVFWGIILVRIVGWTGRKTIFRPFSKKKKKNKNTEQTAYQQPAAGQPYYGPAQNGPVSYYPPRNGGFQAQPHPSGNYQDPYSSGAYRGQPYPSGNYQGQPYPSGNYQGPYPSGNYQGQPHPSGNYQGPYPSGNYQGQPHPSGAYQRTSPSRNDDTSDRLSEDMSLKKLMHDLKDQKRDEKESRSEKKTGE